MKTLRLKTVDAFVSFDLECPTSAGGTRLAPDVTERETQLLARAMTYKFAVLGVNFGGAKGAIKAAAAERDDAVRRYVDEIRPMVESATFLTATDLGTVPDDFRSLPGTDQADLMHTDYMGMPLDAFLTGLGVATAAEMAMRGARLIAFSTIHGCVRRPEGFDVDALLELRKQYGDRLVEHLGVEVRPAADLFAVEADVLVPGARIGVIDEPRARALKARVVAPGANVPYTAGALDGLKERRIPALADFVCNAGATIGYVTDGLRNADEAVAAVEKRVRNLTQDSLRDARGAVWGAGKIAETHLRTWVDEAQMPDGPPLA